VPDAITSAADIAKAVTGRTMSAVEAIDAALARIAKHDGVLNSFTDITAERARAKARAIDTAIAAGQSVGPLAGVPFAVKNLFDVEGLPTRAGSKINRDLPPATRDATLIARMEAAGAVLVGALNMGEYARHHAHERRLVGWLGQRGGRRPGADRAGVRHQRLDPGAIVVLRHLRPEADLRPVVAGAVVSVRRQPRPPRPVRAQRGRSRAGL
jgi:hypothetical protein